MKKRNILVTNVRDYCTDEVADQILHVSWILAVQAIAAVTGNEDFPTDDDRTGNAGAG